MTENNTVPDLIIYYCEFDHIQRYHLHIMSSVAGTAKILHDV